MFGDAKDIRHGGHGVRASGNQRRDAKRFFRSVERSIDGANEILVLGPSTAKLEFVRYLRKHAHGLERKVIGIETMAQATDGQLNTVTQEYFPSKSRNRERMSPNE